MATAHGHLMSYRLVATEICRQAGHRLADEVIGKDGSVSNVCLTCTEAWGRLDGLRAWQESCPCCFSEAHPNGLPELGISADVQFFEAAPAGRSGHA